MGSKEISNTACQIRAVLLLSPTISPVPRTAAWVHHECSSPYHALELSSGPVVSCQYTHRIASLLFLFRISSELLQDARRQF